MEEFLENMFHEMHMVEALGKETAEKGTEIIEEKLKQIIQAAEMKALGSLAPVDFLEHASRKLWQVHGSLEPILYLYEKYFEVQVNIPNDIGPRIGIGYTALMGEIAASLTGADRKNVIDSTVAFLTRHDPDIVDRVVDMAYFALSLFENGAKSEAKQMANLLKTNVPSILEGQLSENVIKPILKE